jgi:hypothetical protein
MGLGESNPDGLEFSAASTQFSRTNQFGQIVEDIFAEEFRGGVDAIELWQFIEIAIVQWGQHRPQVNTVRSAS